MDSYLASEGVLKRSPVLETYETKAAHVYLSLQLRDEVQEKGLTRVSFEALIRSVLIRTNSEHRMTRNDLKIRMHQLLPKDPVERVDQLTDSALTRLAKRAIRHWPTTDASASHMKKVSVWRNIWQHRSWASSRSSRRFGTLLPKPLWHLGTLHPTWTQPQSEFVAFSIVAFTTGRNPLRPPSYSDTCHLLEQTI